MEVKATAKYIRIAPRKLRIVMNLIRGKKVNEAFAILQFTPKVGSEVVERYCAAPLPMLNTTMT